MNTYTLLYWVVTAVAVIAAILGTTIATVLVCHVKDNLNAILVSVMDEHESYAEAEWERRNETRSCDDEISALAYFGVMYLVERWLFVRKYNAVWFLVTVRDNGLGVALARQIRKPLEKVVANNMRRYMNGRMGYGWRTTGWIEDGEQACARFPRLVRVFDAVQGVIFA